MILGIDPGVHLCGWAWLYKCESPVEWRVWLCGRTSPADLVDIIHFNEDRPGCVARSLVTVEFPKVYPVTRSKGDPNDIVELARVCGMIEGACRVANIPFARYYPHEWKRQIPKKMAIERVQALLDPASKIIVEKQKKGDREHIYDAIGVGLYHLGRRIY